MLRVLIIGSNEVVLEDFKVKVPEAQAHRSANEIADIIAHWFETDLYDEEDETHV